MPDGIATPSITTLFKNLVVSITNLAKLSTEMHADFARLRTELRTDFAKMSVNFAKASSIAPLLVTAPSISQAPRPRSGQRCKAFGNKRPLSRKEVNQSHSKVCNSMKKGSVQFLQMLKPKFGGIFNAPLLSSLAKNGYARHMFDEMPSLNTRSWSMMPSDALFYWDPGDQNWIVAFASALMEIAGLVLLVGENYSLKLKQSMQTLLAEIPKESSDFSLFVDAFHELTEAKVDPPSEVIWVYAAINFHSRNLEKGDALDRILATKDLFQMLFLVSASKSIALLVPVVFVVHKVLLELLGSELRLKKEKKAMREVKSLVDTVPGYISVCCSKISEEEPDSVSLNLIFPFPDLARVWLDSVDGFESLLPLVSHDVCGWLSSRDFHVGYLADAVIMEAFFLKLCLSLHLETPRDELEKNMKSWAVGSISSFQNIYFLEIIMRGKKWVPLRVVFVLIKLVCFYNFFSRTDLDGNNPAWKAMGYKVDTREKFKRKERPLQEGLIETMYKTDSTLVQSLTEKGLEVTEDVKQNMYNIKCDVVIVSSGCGGGVAAAVLANYCGLMPSLEGKLMILAGSTVGGGSAINWSVCIRTPDPVLREWSQKYKIPFLRSSNYQSAMDTVCRRIGVTEQCNKESFQNHRQECEKTGLKVESIAINSSADFYCGSCCSGCRTGCRTGYKKGTDTTWLIDAVGNAAVILSNVKGREPLKAIPITEPRNKRLRNRNETDLYFSE